MSNISNIIDLLKIMNQFYQDLQGYFKFDSKGWPIFKKGDFLEKTPEDVVDFANRNNHLITSKRSRTLLAFFEADKLIYPRFTKFNHDLKIYKEYAGVSFPDITVTADMDIELQKTIILANHLFAANLVKNGIKVVMNTRTTLSLNQDVFKNIPTNVMCISGFLGCDTSKNFFEASDYTNKILTLQPNKLLIYGKHDSIIDKQLSTLGINYFYYPDFHTRCYIHRKVAYE